VCITRLQVPKEQLDELSTLLRLHLRHSLQEDTP
jgi:hypothetical protein